VLREFIYDFIQNQSLELTMGQVRSRIVRPFKNYNVEHRAEKILEKRQTVPESAPKHETTVKKFDRFREENPELLEAVNTKYESLHDKLKTVYVESQGTNTEIKPAKAREPIKLSREFREESELGSMEVDYEVPEGRVSLRTALEILSQHQLSPESITAGSIAKDHKLQEQQVQHVLTHFKVLQLHIPKEMYAKNKNMKKLVQQQIDHGKSYMTQNLKIPTDSEIKEVKEQLKNQLPSRKDLPSNKI